MLAVKQKNTFNESEEAAWNKQFIAAEAQLNFEKGKASILESNFVEAREFIAKSNEFYRKKSWI
jgi:hypothetical protein